MHPVFSSVRFAAAGLLLLAVAASPQAFGQAGAVPSTPAEQALQLARRAEAVAAAGDNAGALRIYEAACKANPADSTLLRGMLLLKQKTARLTDAEAAQLRTLLEIQKTQTDMLLLNLRQGLLNCRLSLEMRQPQRAYDISTQALAQIAAAPGDVDLVQYKNGFERVQAESKRALGRNGADLMQAPESAGASQPPAGPSAQVAAAPAQPSGPNPPNMALSPVPPPNPAVAVEQDASRLASPLNYNAGAAIIDTNGIISADQVRYRYDYNAQTAAAYGAAGQLTQADAAQVVPMGVTVNPPMWAARKAADTAPQNGVVLQGPEYQGPDGQQYSMAIYDMGDAAMDPPMFVGPYQFQATLGEAAEIAADRQYLRMRSQIYGGYADDLAAGIPLLQFFGGISDQYVTPNSNGIAAGQLMMVLENFISQQNAAAGFPPPGQQPQAQPQPGQPPAPPSSAPQAQLPPQQQMQPQVPPQNNTMFRPAP